MMSLNLTYQITTGAKRWQVNIGMARMTAAPKQIREETEVGFSDQLQDVGPKPQKLLF